MNNYQDYINRKRKQYGEKFDSSALAEKFVPYFDDGKRIEVNFVGQDGSVYETKRGTIGITTGWKPCFLLMLTRRSIGSSHTLKQRDVITRVV